jgi:hypothetical protein
MAIDDDDVNKWGCAILGGLVGAAIIQGHHDERKKSQAEKDDPAGVEELCEIVGELLNDWEPPFYETEDEYTDDLHDYLDGELDPNYSLVKRRTTIRGIPDVLINKQLVLELKVDPVKSERDRLIGQCCEYSRSYVTWAIVIDMDEDRVEELRGLLQAKSLNYIDVIPFNCEEEDDHDDPDEQEDED